MPHIDVHAVATAVVVAVVRRVSGPGAAVHERPARWACGLAAPAAGGFPAAARGIAAGRRGGHIGARRRGPGRGRRSLLLLLLLIEDIGVPVAVAIVLATAVVAFSSGRGEFRRGRRGLLARSCLAALFARSARKALAPLALSRARPLLRARTLGTAGGVQHQPGSDLKPGGGVAARVGSGVAGSFLSSRLVAGPARVAALVAALVAAGRVVTRRAVLPFVAPWQGRGGKFRRGRETGRPLGHGPGGHGAEKRHLRPAQGSDGTKAHGRGRNADARAEQCLGRTAHIGLHHHGVAFVIQAGVVLRLVRPRARHHVAGVRAPDADGGQRALHLEFVRIGLHNGPGGHAEGPLGQFEQHIARARRGIEYVFIEIYFRILTLRQDGIVLEGDFNGRFRPGDNILATVHGIALRKGAGSPP